MTKQFTMEIQTGAALLDRLRPGWEDKVDLAKFTIGDPERCVIGQTNPGDMGFYDALREELFPGVPLYQSLSELAPAYGFSLCSHMWIYMDTINQEWRDFIVARRLQKLKKQNVLV